MRLDRSTTAALLLTALTGTLARAESEVKYSVYHNSQFHVRGGPLSGTISSPGTTGNSISTPNAIDLEYEYLAHPKHSYFLHTTMAYDMSTARMPYASIGGGFRYYFNSTGASYEVSAKGLEVSSLPRWRYYAGAGVGVSQVIVQVFTEALTVNSSLLEVGAHAGTIYQLNRSTGLELQGGYGMGFGFSNVAAGATVTRIMVGLSVYF